MVSFCNPSVHHIARTSWLWGSCGTCQMRYNIWSFLHQLTLILKSNFGMIKTNTTIRENWHVSSQKNYWARNMSNHCWEAHAAKNLATLLEVSTNSTSLFHWGYLGSKLSVWYSNIRIKLLNDLHWFTSNFCSPLSIQPRWQWNWSQAQSFPNGKL